MTAEAERLLATIEGLRPVDRHFGLELARRARRDPEAIALAGALTCLDLGSGHLCLDLDGDTGSGRQIAETIGTERLLEALHAEDTVCQGIDGVRPRPLVLDGRRLYLHRYWRAEQRVAMRLRGLASRHFTLHPDTVHWLHRLYPDDDSGSAGQKAACAMALTRGLGVISGGPGTGKTTTVARLLVLLGHDAAARGERLAVHLGAPTGKAAARVGEALVREVQQLASDGLLEPALHVSLPERAMTLHRLLGAGTSRGFTHDRANPLAADVVVVDECSMVDLRLLDALLDALPAHARLILLGDRDQLAAVEPGNVFGALCTHAGSISPARAAELQELCEAAPKAAAGTSVIGDTIAVLRHSYRFDAASGIGRLAAAVNAGEHAAVLAAIGSDDAVHASSYSNRPDGLQLHALRDAYRGMALAAIEAAGNRDAIATLPRLQDTFRILCALREGDTGVVGINRLLMQALTEAGLAEHTRTHYPGLPLIITRNDHGLRLYNGDLGIVVDDADGHPQVVFADGGGVRLIPPARLPEHEPAYALTVHKSQGSEFDRITLLLPPAAAAGNVAGRELLYTAITRARKSVQLLLPDGEIDPCWLEPTLLRSGLAKRLHQRTGHEPAASDA